MQNHVKHVVKMMHKVGITKCYYSEANKQKLLVCNPSHIMKETDNSIGLKILNIEKVYEI